MARRKCKICGEWFKVESKESTKKYCSRYCSRLGAAKTRESKNRPLTENTAYIVNMWYDQGDSVELIAKVLNRNKKTIQDIVEGRIS